MNSLKIIAISTNASSRKRRISLEVESRDTIVKTKAKMQHKGMPYSKSDILSCVYWLQQPNGSQKKQHPYKVQKTPYHVKREDSCIPMALAVMKHTLLVPENQIESPFFFILSFLVGSAGHVHE